MSGSGDMFDAVVTLLVQAGFREVIRGLPDTMDTDTVAYVLTGPRSVEITRGGLGERAVTFYTYTGYRVDSKEENAERMLLSRMDTLEDLWLESRKDDQGPFRGSTLDSSIAANPEYRDFTHQEYRLYPLSFRMVQRFNFPMGV